MHSIPKISPVDAGISNLPRACEGGELVEVDDGLVDAGSWSRQRVMGTDGNGLIQHVDDIMWMKNYVARLMTRTELQ